MILKGKIPTRMVLGIPIANVRLKEISAVIASLIEGRYKAAPAKKTIFYVDAQHLNIAERDHSYKKILQGATLAYAAGIGPILASKILGQSLPERNPPEDFIEEIFDIAKKKKWSFYFLGGEDGVAKETAQRLRKRFPNLAIAGYHHGFFSDNSEIVKKINQAKPDIILVGMGAPRQEKWIVNNVDKVNAKAFLTVGGLFEILSGRRKRAPVFMQKLGLEWAFRLFQEPRRLWRRYLFGNTSFLLIVFQEKGFFFRKGNR